MRILHVYKDYAPIRGGIESHIRLLAEGQAGAGHDVTVIVTDPGAPPPAETGVRLLRLPRIATVASTPLSVRLPAAIRRQSPDVTHLHFPYPPGEVAQWLAGRDRPYVITYHSDVVRQKLLLSLYRPLMRLILRRARRIIATSRRYVDSSPVLRPLSGMCSIVPLATEADRFAAARPLSPRNGTPTILFVGRHRHYKGVDDLLRAMVGLEARLLVGGDGPLRAPWEQLAGSLGLGDRVRFLGEVPEEDLPRLYASADLFALPSTSRAEAFGMVLLEAMAAGLACVTTELGTGTSFVVQDGITGAVVPPRDPEALRAALRPLLRDPGLRGRMGAAGRLRVRDEFSPEKMVRGVEAVYRRALYGTA